MLGLIQQGSSVRRVLALLSLMLLTATGCQTWIPEAGVTMPTAYYPEHPPQFIPPSPPFSLNREMRTMQEAYQQPVPQP